MIGERPPFAGPASVESGLRIPVAAREPMVAGLEVVPFDAKKEGTLDSLVADVAAGVRVLRHRDGVLISEDQVMDRARNIVSGLIHNYGWPKVHR